MSIQQYHSNLATMDYYSYPDPPVKGKGWFISFEEDLSSCTVTQFEDHIYPAKVIVIHASSQERAQYIADMLYASQCLIDAELPSFEPTRVFPVSITPLQDTFKQESTAMSTKPFSYYGQLSLACFIAAKVSYRKVYQYALFKHLLSHQTLSTNVIDIDPSNWWPGCFVSFSANHHTHCAYAIIAAYSVLEELGLELRASTQNPSTINGDWNPVVRNELETRLLRADINLSETITWHMRDTPTKIERVRPPRTQAKAEWAYGKVRDVEVEIVDAIAYSSWLRSKVSAHKLRELSESLNYYDVSNVQFLARRLLLEALGFLRYQPLRLSYSRRGHH